MVSTGKLHGCVENSKYILSYYMCVSIYCKTNLLWVMEKCPALTQREVCQKNVQVFTKTSAATQSVFDSKCAVTI